MEIQVQQLQLVIMSEMSFWSRCCSAFCQQYAGHWCGTSANVVACAASPLLCRTETHPVAVMLWLMCVAHRWLPALLDPH